MKNNKIEELLNRKAKLSIPELKPDPFLPTRIEALMESKRQSNTEKVQISNWSFASVITAFAVIIGVYIGAGISDADSLQNNDDVFNEYSQAFYQSGFTENWDSALDNGGSDQ